jgi:iron complex transport system permease protein
LKRWTLPKLLLTFAIGALIWLIAAAASSLVGSTGTGIPTKEIFLEERLPRILLASLVGACLAAAGTVYQAILRNPLADPYLLGVSSGSALFAYFWRLPAASLLTTSLFASPITQQVFAFAGGLASIAIVFALAARRGRLEPLTLLLTGVIVNIINAALFLLLNELYHDQSTQASFLIGGLQTPSQLQLQIVTYTAALCFFLLLLITPQLNVALLSEAEAESLGLQIHRVRWIALILASLMTASVIAISGPIGFVGLICPHLARLIAGNDQRKLFPLATATGAALLALADAASHLLSQSQFTGYLLPVGILTALLGGPFFLLLLWRTRRRNEVSV